MTPTAFIDKWQANTRNERSAAQEHFLDLCALLDEPTPNTDPTGAAYAFEKGATKASGGEGWADVWRRARFAWEYKGKHKDLDAAHRQILQYAGALESPPLLVTCDIKRVVSRSHASHSHAHGAVQHPRYPGRRLARRPAPHAGSRCCRCLRLACGPVGGRCTQPFAGVEPSSSSFLGWGCYVLKLDFAHSEVSWAGHDRDHGA